MIRVATVLGVLNTVVPRVIRVLYLATGISDCKLHDEFSFSSQKYEKHV
jgi:hypothetical protein